MTRNEADLKQRSRSITREFFTTASTSHRNVNSCPHQSPPPKFVCETLCAFILPRPHIISLHFVSFSKTLLTHIVTADVNGTVRCRAYKGTFAVLGRSSSSEKLYDMSESSMDEIGDFAPSETGGFIVSFSSAVVAPSSSYVIRGTDVANTQGVQAIRLKKYGSMKSEAGERM